MIIDSHCHLTNKGIGDIKKIIENASAAGVKVIHTICTHLGEFSDVLNIANTYHNVFCSVGVHPMHIEGNPPSLDEIIKLTQHEKVISIGETGLDYYYSSDTKKEQIESFISHIESSQETGLPLIIHTREADEDMVNILKKYVAKKEFSAVIHCFTASKWLAMECIDMGFYISASGIITFKNAEDIRSTFMQIPIDKILIETDAPYLAPAPHRGKTNEPALLVHTLEFLSNMLGKGYDELSKQTTNNFYKLFKKAKI